MKKYFTKALWFLRSFVWLADTLSFLRAPAAVTLIFLWRHDQWKWALVILVAGWLTDAFDGPAARRYGSLRDRWPSLDIDGYADIVLAFTSSLILMIYAWDNYYAGWTLNILWIASLMSGVAMVHKVKTGSDEAEEAIIIHMVFFHFLFQMVVTIGWFAYKAEGWAFGVVVAIVLLLYGPVSPKFKLWRKGRLQ